MGELLVLRGETDGISTSGTVSLYSDILAASADYVMIPKGMKCKIWFKKVSGEGETLFTLQYTYDVTSPRGAWMDIEQEKLASKGEISIDKRRPLVLRGLTGREAFRVVWSQPTPVKAYIELGVEMSDEE